MRPVEYSLLEINAIERVVVVDRRDRVDEGGPIRGSGRRRREETRPSPASEGKRDGDVLTKGAKC